MHRVMVLLATIAVMVTLFATAAYAARDYTSIVGTREGETLHESNLDDVILGRAGSDTLQAAVFTSPAVDEDLLQGNSGDDRLEVNDGDPFDTANGGPGFDTCLGDQGDRLLNCESIPEGTPAGGVED